jgi:hypothetical protein
LGEFQERTPTTQSTKDSRFCVAMDLESRWVSTIDIGGTKGEAVVVVVNFEKYPIKCHFCASLAHFIKDCQAFRAQKYTIKWAKHALGGSRKEEKGNKVDQEVKKGGS